MGNDVGAHGIWVGPDAPREITDFPEYRNTNLKCGSLFVGEVYGIKIHVVVVVVVVVYGFALRIKSSLNPNQAGAYGPEAEHQNIYDLAQAIVKDTQCTVNVVLCARIALMRKVYLKHPGNNFWDKIDDRNEANGDAKKTTRAFRHILTQDQDKHGAKTYVLDDTVDAFQLQVDELINPVLVTIFWRHLAHIAGRWRPPAVQMARGLKTLESTQVTCSDVFTIWIGIAIGFQNVFSDPSNAINKYHQETVDCYNRRFAIFMNDCTPGMFVLAYLLDPVYYHDGAIRLELPPRVNFEKETASPFVVYLVTSARLMLQHEQKRERSGTAAEGDILVKQIISYMYGEAPFDLSCTDMSLRLAWWKTMSKDSNANILARLGIKLFSVVPSEMCDERTASKLTAMSTAKRNNLGPENLIQCAQLNQYWRYGFGSSEVKQHCQKVRLELPTANRKPSDPVVAGIPTLQDLLNADSEQVAIDEDALFNHPDPYGMEDLEAMEEGEDDTDTAAPPLVIRRANFPTLEIEAYIDLKAPKLTQRFAATQGMPEEPTARPAKLPAKPSTGS
ncbi:hypothetical protein B0H14DRAFT_3454874 [Mycena olivaceomarginata]|nr:hypothetical protein B0H14DRAFT_3454874 [Mycena olivaceomarginata]